MKPVKLYYDSFPGKKLCYDFIRSNIRKYYEWQTGRYHFHDILNELSIPWEWTTDPKQGMVICDIESTSPENLELFIDEFDRQFDRYVVLSMTEPRYGYVSDRVNSPFKRYPNAFFMDISMPNTSTLHLEQKRYFQFPFFIFRNTSSAVSGFLCHGEHLMERPETKKYDFNHLSYNCRFEKFISHYYLKEKYQVDNCLYSFRPATDPNIIENIYNAIKHQGNLYSVNTPDIERMLQRIKDEPFETIELDGDLNFNTNERQHPRSLYEKTCISLVTESYHDAAVYIFTEKTMHPLMNAHPFVANGSQYYNRFLTEQGFVLYSELFDYSFDALPNIFARTNAVAKQAQIFNRDALHDNLLTTVDKVQHNKNLLTNKNSSLFVKYRELMLEYIDRYYSL